MPMGKAGAVEGRWAAAIRATKKCAATGCCSRRGAHNSQLLIPQSFCSTSISVKVSMMSPCCMSLKFTRLMPHSSPAATSLASSL